MRSKIDRDQKNANLSKIGRTRSQKNNFGDLRSNCSYAALSVRRPAEYRQREAARNDSPSAGAASLAHSTGRRSSICRLSEWTRRGGAGGQGRQRGELKNEVFSALALLITKLWMIYCFVGQRAFKNEYIGMIRVQYINTTIKSFIHCHCERGGAGPGPAAGKRKRRG